MCETFNKYMRQQKIIKLGESEYIVRSFVFHFSLISFDYMLYFDLKSKTCISFACDKEKVSDETESKEKRKS